MDVPESEKVVSTEDAKNWCLENGNLPLVETSAKNALNVEIAFDAAVAAWSKLDARIENPMIDDTVDLSKNLSSQRSNCCLPI